MDRTSRWLLAGCTVIAGVVGGLAGTWLVHGSDALAEQAEQASQPADRLTVQEVTIVDEQGRSRIFMGIRDGCPRVSLKDETGQVRAFVGQMPPPAEDKPSYWMMNLVDAKGNPRTVCAARDDGKGSTMQVRDNGGAMRFVVGYTDQGNGGLTLRDQHNKKRFAIGMPAHAGYSMHFMDEQEQAIWSAPGGGH